MYLFVRSLRSLSVVLISCSLFSCASLQKFREDTYNARDKEHKAFVEKKDGEVVQANEARLRAPLFGKSSIELDNNEKIPLKEVAAYQNAQAYYRLTPSGFAPRIKKGLINMYLTTESYQVYEAPSTSSGATGRWSNRTRYVYYIQKGDQSEVFKFTPKLTEQMVQDYAPAMEFIDVYHQTQKQVRTWSWINTAAVVGGLVLAGATGVDHNGNVTATGYGGLGLAVGGGVNGLVNKIRRVKNVKNLELAIDTYNFQTVKRKR